MESTESGKLLGPTIYNVTAGVRLYLCRLRIENKRLAPYPCDSLLSQPSLITSFSYGDYSRSQGTALATPLSSTMKEPFSAPLKVPCLIHSISAALNVAWGPAQGVVPP